MHILSHTHILPPVDVVRVDHICGRENSLPVLYTVVRSSIHRSTLIYLRHMFGCAILDFGMCGVVWCDVRRAVGVFFSTPSSSVFGVGVCTAAVAGNFNWREAEGTSPIMVHLSTAGSSPALCSVTPKEGVFFFFLLVELLARISSRIGEKVKASADTSRDRNTSTTSWRAILVHICIYTRDIENYMSPPPSVTGVSILFLSFQLLYGYSSTAALLFLYYASQLFLTAYFVFFFPNFSFLFCLQLFPT